MRVPRCSAGCSLATTAGASCCASRIRTPSAARRPTPLRSWKTSNGWACSGTAVPAGHSRVRNITSHAAAASTRAIRPRSMPVDLRTRVTARRSNSTCRARRSSRPGVHPVMPAPAASCRPRRACARAHRASRPRRGFACPPAGASNSTTWCTERRASRPMTSATSSCGAPMAARRSSSAMPSTMRRWASPTCCVAKITSPTRRASCWCSRRWSCARPPTAISRCWWARMARRSPSVTAPPACASSANGAIYPPR